MREIVYLFLFHLFSGCGGEGGASGWASAVCGLQFTDARAVGEVGTWWEGERGKRGLCLSKTLYSGSTVGWELRLCTRDVEETFFPLPLTVVHRLLPSFLHYHLISFLHTTPSFLSLFPTSRIIQPGVSSASRLELRTSNLDPKARLNDPGSRATLYLHWLQHYIRYHRDCACSVQYPVP